MLSRLVRVSTLTFLVALWINNSCSAQTVARCGQGWLEQIDGYLVLHVKGTPYEMGYQQGALLKDRVHKNMDNILVQKCEQKFQVGFLKLKPRDAIDAITTIQRPFVPAKYFSEMEGVAAGAELKTKDVVAANFIPELFHCSGFAVMNSATKDGTLYHGRVLDYAIDWGLQDHAVLVVAEPDGAIPFVNVTYPGFIGSVTGMNAEHVSIGEMGGGGLGHWAGVPMSFLVREVLERGKDLETAIAIFRDNPRTCQYFYVVADAKTNRAVGMEASWDNFFTVGPGEAHVLLPTPVKDSVLLSAGGRYKELVRRAQAGYGSLDADAARHLMDCGVAMKSNLHNVLFEPKSTKLWIANATTDKKPAADQKYHEFQLSELLKRRPDMSAPVLKLVAKTAALQTSTQAK
ncbi:MAG: peptidase C45 [Planctomycetales bacterium]|nr:peptidase C45 [Planctomycetales bacterium]